jgi:hypothetical protein
MTTDDLMPYVHPLAAVMRTLRRVQKTVPYGDVAKDIGFKTGQKTFPHLDFDRLINLTADVVDEHSPDFWQWMVNAKTGKPGQGIYR